MKKLKVGDKVMYNNVMLVVQPKIGKSCCSGCHLEYEDVKKCYFVNKTSKCDNRIGINNVYKYMEVK